MLSSPVWRRRPYRGPDAPPPDEAGQLDEEQEKLIERRFARQYHLIVRPDRLEAIAKDIVRHFVGRGYRGKAMMVCIDKATAVTMYDRVQRHWKEHIGELKTALKKTVGDKRATIEEKIRLMETTDMAVVVSQSQNEVEDLKAKGIDIVPHRKRMLREDLDETFKDPNSNLHLYATAEFAEAETARGSNQPNCRLSTSSAGRFAVADRRPVPSPTTRRPRICQRQPRQRRTTNSCLPS
jgi:hypothetical protein